MRYLDVTLPLGAGTPLFPGDPPFHARPWSAVTNGGFAVTGLRLGSHTGTHVDAPAHCLPGSGTVDDLPLKLLCGEAFVWDISREDAGELQSMAAVPRDAVRVLLRTRGRGQPFDSARPGGIDLPAARALTERNVRLLGIDRLSIADGEQSLPVHRFLLERGVIIVEGLDLREAVQGRYGLLCLPLRLAGGDGAPARVVLTLPSSAM